MSHSSPLAAPAALRNRKKCWRRVTSVLDRAALGAHFFGGIVLAIMMLLTAMDVIGRFLLNSPIKGTQELSAVMLILIVFSGVAYTALQKEHVCVELFIMCLPRKTRLLLGVFTSLISLVLVAGIASQGLVQMTTHQQRLLTTTLLGIPLWPFALLLSSGAWLLCLVLTKDTVTNVRNVLAETWRIRHLVIPGICLAGFCGLIIY